MIQIKTTVLRYLENHASLRDNDNELMVAIWREQTTSADFFANFRTGRLTSPESIRRTRQQLQEQHPYLRGETYRLRHDRQIKIQHELGYNVKG